VSARALYFLQEHQTIADRFMTHWLGVAIVMVSSCSKSCGKLASPVISITRQGGVGGGRIVATCIEHKEQQVGDAGRNQQQAG
jgi:hypothetical protein